MKASELRIGNYIKQPNGVNMVFRISEGEDVNTFPEEEIDPIPLSEEWLLRVRFKKHQGWLCKDAWSPGHPSQRFDLYWSEIDGFMMKSRYQEDVPGNFYMRHIQYVHQLQNLYFALTGEELTLKSE